MTDYATDRAEAKEQADDNRVAEYQAHQADYDRADDGRFWNYADGYEPPSWEKEL